MICTHFAGGFVCTRARPRKRCQEDGCPREGSFQCDYPTVNPNGIRSGKTCDRYACELHAVVAGTDRHFCLGCAPRAARQGLIAPGLSPGPAPLLPRQTALPDPPAHAGQ